MKQIKPELAPELMAQAKRDVAQRFKLLQNLADLPGDSESK